MNNIKWTKEKCQEEANKFNRRVDFAKKANGAYNASIKYGFLDEVCLHMYSGRKPNKYWTKERCYEEAMKYDFRGEFRKKSPAAYCASFNGGYLDDVCKHMTYKHNHWTKEMCHNEALKYNTETRFYSGNQNAYNSAKRNGWFDEICSHMIPKYAQSNHINWTKEMCHEEALKYDTRAEFRKYSKKIYDQARNNGWLIEICSHMIKTGNKMFRCIYVYEFSDNFAYVGLTYNLKIRNANRKRQKDDNVTKHIEQTGLVPILRQLTDYISVIDASILENDFIEKYKINGWNMLNKAKGGALGTSKKMWTLEKCQTFAIKYKTRSEFYNKSNRAYTAAQRYGWLDSICTHMLKPKPMPANYWTKERCLDEAVKYNNNIDFLHNSNGAYRAARKRGWLSDICSHMENK